MPDDPLLTSLLAAVTAAPDDVPLRLHVAELLVERDRLAEALQHCSHVLGKEPSNSTAVSMLQRITARLEQPSEPAAPATAGFDWRHAEEEVADIPDRRPERAFHPVADHRGHRTPDACGSPTWAAWSRSSNGWRSRSSARCATRRWPRRSARASPADCCSTARPAAARHSSDARWPGSSAPTSSMSASPTCSTSTPDRASATSRRSSTRPAATRPACSSSTRSTRSARNART